MNSEAGYITAKKGQAVCRPSTWTDIGLFFAFNYGLHVITMVSPPGSSPFYNFTTALLSLLLPFSGIGTALQVIYRRGIQSASSDLQIAHRAGALCMLIRRDQVPEDSWEVTIPPRTIVHGQHPCTTASVPSDNNESAPPVETCLLHVPRSFIVHPPRNSGPTPFLLASNYSILKGVAGIVQILAGSFGLYHVSQRQLPKLGYASYSLTVVPYILMSFVNLLACMCEPQYPSMFLVIYRGLEPQSPTSVAIKSPVSAVRLESRIVSTGPADDIAAAVRELSHGPAAASDPLQAQVFGAVGEAYGDLSKLNASLARPPGSRSVLVKLLVTIGCVLCIVTPYIIIQVLTGFHAGHSTASQRGWLMSWLVIGQFHGAAFVPGGPYSDVRSNGNMPRDRIGSYCYHFFGLLFILILGTAAIGGFVVVGQMIANDQICTII